MISALLPLIVLVPFVLLILITVFAVKYNLADKDSKDKIMYSNYMKACIKILIVYAIIIIALVLLLHLTSINGLPGVLGNIILVLMLFIIFLLPIILLVLLFISFVLFLITRKSDIEKSKKYKKLTLKLLVSLVISIVVSFGLMCYLSYMIMSTM